MGDQPGEQSLVRRLTRAGVTEVLALAGLVVYGVTYTACVIVYGAFGVEPADVGLGYADVIGQAAVYFVIVGVIAAPAIAFFGFADRRWLKDRVFRGDPPSARPHLFVVASGVAATVIVVTGAVSARGDV